MDQPADSRDGILADLRRIIASEGSIQPLDRRPVVGRDGWMERDDALSLG